MREMYIKSMRVDSFLQKNINTINYHLTIYKLEKCLMYMYVEKNVLEWILLKMVPLQPIRDDYISYFLTRPLT